MLRRRIYQTIVFIVLLLLCYGGYYFAQVINIAVGAGAKIMCSALFVSGRHEQTILAEDLNFFPLSTASYTINYQDSTVTCSMLGFAKAKAIYRNGLGATLVHDMSEGQIRSQFFNVPGHPLLNRDTVPWPMGDNISVPFPINVDSLKIAKALSSAFLIKDTGITNLTRAVIVVYDGKVIAEKYAEGFSSHTKLAGWSMTKSITGALVGILVKEKKLSLEGTAPVAEWNDANDPRHQVTLQHLLQQTSGLDFNEIYHKPADANRMLFAKGDAAAYAASKMLAKKPGTYFSYSSGNSNILSRICRLTIGEENYQSFPYVNLFYKLGMYNTVLEPDASGTFVGSSFCYATARDWARFGLLYLNKGLYNNEQILPTDWVQRSTTPSTEATMGEYGLQWWLNAGSVNDPRNRKYPDLPQEMYYASGYEAQHIFIIPSKKVVVVRLGLTRGPHWGESEFLQAVLTAIKD